MADYGKIYYGSTLVGDVHMPPVVGDFAGLSFSPGPMYVTEGGEYGLCRSFNEHCSYGASSLGNIGYVDGYRTYFQIIELGKHFDSSGSNWETNLYTEGGHNINNQGNLVYGADNAGNYHSDWHMPTFNEFNKIFFPVSGSTLTRAGSTVNGVSSVVGVAVRVQKTTSYASTVPGVIAFPDNQTITGADIITSDSTSDYYAFQSLAGHPITYSNGYVYITGAMQTPAHLITENELNEFIKQGCVFLPDMGRAYPETATSSIAWLSRDSSYTNEWYGINFTTYVQTSSSATVYGYFFGSDYTSALAFGAGNYNQVTGGFKDYLHTYTPAYLVRNL